MRRAEVGTNTSCMSMSAFWTHLRTRSGPCQSPSASRSWFFLCQSNCAVDYTAESTAFGHHCQISDATNYDSYASVGQAG